MIAPPAASPRTVQYGTIMPPRRVRVTGLIASRPDRLLSATVTATLAAVAAVRIS
jgi:hypothetical protein